MYPILCLTQHLSQVVFIIQELEILTFGHLLVMELLEQKLEQNIILNAYVSSVIYVFTSVGGTILLIKHVFHI